MIEPPARDPWCDLLRDPESWLAGWIADPAVAARAQAAVGGAAAQFGAAALAEALGRARDAPTPRTNVADPVLRAVMRAWMAAIVRTTVAGVQHLGVVGTRPVVILSNHLSFADTTATECALLRAGGAARALADRMWALAGPRVWDEPLHAVASTALNLLPAPQSARVGADPADTAAVLRALTLARERLAARDPLLVYAEGTRSRTGRLAPFLAGIRHYLGVPGTVVLPLALTGTDRLYPVGARSLKPGGVDVRIGAPIEVNDPVRTLVDAHRSLAALLPDGYRPAAGAPPVV